MKNTFLKLKAVGLICCMTLFSAADLSAIQDGVKTDSVVASSILKSCRRLLDIKGKHLGCEKFNSLYEFALEMDLKKGGFATAVDKFKNAIKNNPLLKEAVFQTDRAAALALIEIRALFEEINSSLISKDSHQEAVANKHFADGFGQMLADEHLNNVKKGLILVLNALQQYAISKGAISPVDGKPNIRGKVFISTVNAIIKHSLKHYNLHEKSVMLSMLDNLYEGTKGVEKSLAMIEKTWQDPVKAMELLLEIRTFISDVCFAVPEVQNLVGARAPDDFFKACDEKMEEEKKKAAGALAVSKSLKK